MTEKRGKYKCSTCEDNGDITITTGSHPNFDFENVPCPDCSIKPETLAKIEVRIAELSKNKRNLQDDLEICKAVDVRDIIILARMITHPKNKAFLENAVEGWSEAASRAIAAEAEVKELKSTVAVLESLNKGLDIDCDELQAEVERLEKELSFLASQAKIVHSSKHENLLTYKTFPIIVENRCNKALGVNTDADS